MPDDIFLSSPPRKAPAHRRSATSLRTADAADDAANGRFSLAHELAVAMMPEPSAGSKLLAEEFGLEFDEGAEGIDDPVPGGPQIHVQDGDASFADASFADASFADSEAPDPQLHDATFDDEPPDFGGDPTFGSPRAPPREREKDALEVLAADLASTDNFLAHLRRLDDPASGLPSSGASSSQPALERIASDVIRRYNDTARDRETQVRELLAYEREFRRIAGEVGGEDVLGRLDALPASEPEDAPALPSAASLTGISEDVERSPIRTRPAHLRALSQDWETDPDAERLGDTDGDMDPAFAHDEPASPTSPTRAAAAPAAAQQAPATPAAQLASLRDLTATLVGALTSVSEHAQVNGAGAADAGRKLRALRNRLGGWRAEWEGAERSRARIARWEAGEAWEGVSGDTTPATPTTTPSRGAAGKRVDGRTVVAEHLHAFERALADAAVKTKAIMAAS
ncbi:hypothetical protein B0H15DRAFT_35480 [Mycena belliarum]|uniref:Uncharacterized protein n=1 Tax=Mycena belliarum TaxID=1033014 RepID=A0AAD6UHQ5_9AGAR|nr:hypothetical protein B0H15DRAFT_35480 [Mycena belliae]